MADTFDSSENQENYSNKSTGYDDVVVSYAKYDSIACCSSESNTESGFGSDKSSSFDSGTEINVTDRN
ncbi:hypothetical protein HK096_008106, partial [Nowakowskiella sp. JEL0078]